MHAISLKLDDVSWVGYKFLDANAHSFFYKGQFYKAVLPTSSVHNSEKFDILLSRMAERGFIPKTQKTNIKIDNYTSVYHQKTNFFSTTLSEQPFESVKQCSQLILNIFSWLLTHNFTLLDGHTHNIVFQENNKPLWCDIGSIVPYHEETFRSSFDQFVRYFIYPMLIREKSRHCDPIARIGLKNGISHELFHILTGNADFLNIITNRKHTAKSIIDSVLERINLIDFPYIETDWGGYYDNTSDDIDEYKKPKPGENNRESFIISMLKAVRPKYLIDIGANAGRYSRLAAKLGAREVLSIEPDDVAMAKNWSALQREALPITLLQQGVSLTPFKQPGDTAIALALTHHLYFTEKMPFRLIASCLASYTSNHLITEFMPHGMLGKDKPVELPRDYSLEIFAKQLERHFASVEVIEYPFPVESSPRVLIVCNEKRAAPLDDGLGNLNRAPA